MPGMPLIDYQSVPINSDDWIIYSEHFRPTDFSHKDIVKNMFVCNLSGIFITNCHIYSIFQKCNLTATDFYRCGFDEGSMFIECTFNDTSFVQCHFKKEEQVVFLKMSGARLVECTVEGNDGLENWNV
jgi:uncharacterized protein YjbI with pentapeptide repeats